jgi:phenylalanyl-tRNA synthetase beta chain
MKISLNWLNDYIDLSDYRNKIDELCKLLTQAGLEVEGVTDQKAIYNFVTVGKLLSVEKHPDADKLTLCQLDMGEGSPRQIVCGAKNHKAGDYVIAALPGAILPGDFAIKKSKIRGVESLGMLCSAKELGLSADGEGIITMPSGKPGQAFSELYGFDDVIIEINVTPNRADCLSHLGLAFEVSALLDRPLKQKKAEFKTGAFKTTELAKIKLLDPQRCPRYAGRMIRGVKIGESPLWLKKRLESVGLRSVNNVVDVTNYVMFDYGQPLHAFDWSQIQGGEIVIRPSQKNEVFKTLDGTELTLSGEELVIADQKRAVALAGVVGGINSGVTESTKDVFVESAFFNSQAVRRTSRRFGIDTDSCYRFSRGVNPEQTVQALERACELIQQVAGGEVSVDYHDLYPQPLSKSAITVDVRKVEARLGYSIVDADFFAVMKRLGCQVAGNKVTPPLHRWDLAIPEDLVEEYARVHGYEHLVERLPKLVEEPTKHNAEYVNFRRLSQSLSQQGFSQVVNYAFVNKVLQNEVLGTQEERAGLGLVGREEIPVKNPISEDFAILRLSTLPSLVQNVSHNLRHGNLSGQVFEIGKSHYRQNGQYLEEPRLGFALWGQPLGLWSQKAPPVYRLKSFVENLLEVFAPGSKWQLKSLESPLAFIHPGQVVQLVFQGQAIGFVGTVHPQKAKDWKWREEVAFAELNLAALFKATKVPRFQAISAFPAVEKDLAFIVAKTMKAQDVQKEIAKAGGNLLTKVQVVDLYEGEPLREDQRSLAFRLTFQSVERTLADEEVLKLFQQIIDSVSQKLGIQLR